MLSPKTGQKTAGHGGKHPKRSGNGDTERTQQLGEEVTQCTDDQTIHRTEKNGTQKDGQRVEGELHAEGVDRYVVRQNNVKGCAKSADNHAFDFHGSYKPFSWGID